MALSLRKNAKFFAKRGVELIIKVLISIAAFYRLPTNISRCANP